MLKISLGYLVKVSSSDGGEVWSGYFPEMPTIKSIRDAIELEAETYPNKSDDDDPRFVCELVAMVSLAVNGATDCFKDDDIVDLSIGGNLLGSLSVERIASFRADGRGRKAGAKKSKAGRPKGKKSDTAPAPAVSDAA